MIRLNRFEYGVSCIIINMINIEISIKISPPSIMLSRRVVAMIILSFPFLFSMTCRQAKAAPAPGKHLLIEDGDNGDQDPGSEEYVEVYPMQHPGHQGPMRFG